MIRQSKIAVQLTKARRVAGELAYCPNIGQWLCYRLGEKPASGCAVVLGSFMAAGIVQLVAAVRNGHTEGSNKRLLFVVGALYSLHARGLWGVNPL